MLAALVGAASTSAGGAPLEPWLPDGIARPAAYVAASRDSILLSHRADDRRQPASLSKLVAALVTLEEEGARPGLLRTEARVSRRAAAAEGTRAGLRAGERWTGQDLLTAMLVASANDACLALAEHVSGSGERFVDAMNRLAQTLRMNDTRFVDPCGFDRPGQHTTANDLLAVARAVLETPELLRIAGLPSARIVGGRALRLHATNALLGRYEGAFGLKTGYTRQAGPCLIATAGQGSSVAIVVVLGAQDRWPFTVALLDETLERLTGFPRVRSRVTFGEPDT